MRRPFFLALFAVVLASSGTARAQIVVYDPTTYAKLLQQAQTALQQLRQLQAGVAQGQQLYSSFNSASNVNSIASQLSSPQLRQFLPDVSKYVSIANGGFTSLGQIGALANQIRSANRIYTPQPGASASAASQYSASALEQSGDRAARDLALAETVANTAAQRTTGLDQLRQALNTAPNARAVMDLQARIAAEQAMIQNDQMRLQGLAMTQAAEARVQAQRDAEQARKTHDDAAAYFRSLTQ